MSRDLFGGEARHGQRSVEEEEEEEEVGWLRGMDRKCKGSEREADECMRGACGKRPIATPSFGRSEAAPLSRRRGWRRRLPRPRREQKTQRNHPQTMMLAAKRTVRQQSFMFIRHIETHHSIPRPIEAKVRLATAGRHRPRAEC